MKFYDIFKCEDIRQNIFKQKVRLLDKELLEIYFTLKLAFRFNLVLKLMDDVLNGYKNGYTLFRLDEVDLLVNYKEVYEELRGIIDFEYIFLDDMIVSHYHIPIKFRKQINLTYLNKRMKSISKELINELEVKYDKQFELYVKDIYELSMIIKYCFINNLKCHYMFDGVVFKLFNKNGRRISRRNTFLLNSKIKQKFYEFVNINNNMFLPINIDLALNQLKKYL